MELSAFKKLMMRAFPGLGGWHVTRYGKIARVYPAMGMEAQNPARVVADIELLGPNLKRDPRFKKPIMRVPLTSANPYDDTPPEKGRICIISHPYWRADQVIITGYLYTGRMVKVEEKTVQFQGAMAYKFGSAEDFAALYGPLAKRLNELADLIVTCAQSDSFGAPNQNLTAVQTSADSIKNKVPLVKSPVVKIGLNGS